MANSKDKKPPVNVEVFFDVRDGSYWYKVNGRYLQLGKTELRWHFQKLGLSYGTSAQYFDGIQEIDWPLFNATENRRIDYAGSLAGHRVGVFTDGSDRSYLITGEAAGVWEDMPKKAPEPKFFGAFIRELLPNDQWLYFCYWLSIGLRALREQSFMPGQVVFLIGPSQCGKSLLQDIITQVLGGREANPFKYMMELTQFNLDISQAEHWKMEDPKSTTDNRARRQFGDALKEVTVTRTFSIHKKGKDALPLKIMRRVTCSINDETENVARIPPQDHSIMDKNFILKCDKVSDAFAPYRFDGTPSLFKDKKPDDALNQPLLWKTILNEVPAIRAWLLSQFRNVPREMRDDRFGIRAWHHPEILSQLTELTPEARLLMLIDEVLFADDSAPVTIKSIQLEKQLKGSQFGFEVEKLLRFSGACGAYLGRLAKSNPNRITKKVSNGYTSWTIIPPKENHEAEAE
jgi:hypothetical protein